MVRLRSCLHSLKNEFHSQKLSCRVRDGQRWKFTHPQWSSFHFVAYLIWRFIVAGYFIAWLVVTILDFHYLHPTVTHLWLIYATNWTYLTFVAYCIVSFLNVVHEAHLKRSQSRPNRTWYLGLQWLLWNLTAPATLSVLILFWAALFAAKTIELTPATIHVHLINAVVILIDLCIHAMPMQLLHLYLPILFVGSYAIFSAVYSALGGENAKGEHFIYPVILDYKLKPEIAIGADFAAVLLVVPTIWIVLWLLHKVRISIWNRCDLGAHRFDVVHHAQSPRTGVYVIGVGFHPKLDKEEWAYDSPIAIADAA